MEIQLTMINDCFYEHDTIHESRGLQENCQARVQISESKVSKLKEKKTRADTIIIGPIHLQYSLN